MQLVSRRTFTTFRRKTLQFEPGPFGKKSGPSLEKAMSARRHDTDLAFHQTDP